MTTNHVRTSAALLAVAAVGISTWAFMNPSTVKAQTAPSYDAARVAKGLEIAPVALDFAGKARSNN